MICVSVKEENLYLDKANIQPFMDPKQDKATNTGTTTEKLPITLSAKVWDGREKKEVAPVSQHIGFWDHMQNTREKAVAGVISLRVRSLSKACGSRLALQGETTR